MILLVLGFFTLSPSLEILDKNPSKTEAFFSFSSHSLRAQKYFPLLNEKTRDQREKKALSILKQREFQKVKKGSLFILTRPPSLPEGDLPLKSPGNNHLHRPVRRNSVSSHPEQRELKLKRAENLKKAYIPPLLKKQKKNTKEKPGNELNFLKKFSQEKSPLEIHNKALSFLKEDKKEQAFILLKKNIYQNFFFSSYFVLSHFEVPVLFFPFLWSFLLIFIALICLVLLFLSFKTPSSFNLKLLFLSLILGGAFFFSKSLLFKKRVSSFQTMDLRSAPFKKAPINISLSPNSDLVVLKQMGDWLALQNQDKQTGWLKKQEVFQIF